MQEEQEFHRDYDDEFDFEFSSIINKWKQTFFVTKTVIITICIFYIMSLLFLDIRYMVSTLDTTIYNLELYRFLASPLIFSGLFDLLLGVYLFQKESQAFERQYGSITNYIDILFKSIQIQGIFFVFGFILNIVYPKQVIVYEEIKDDGEQQQLDSYNYYTQIINFQSLLPYALSMLTYRCLQQPEKPIMFLCLPIQMKRMYYPIILFAVISIFEYRYDNLAGILLGALNIYIPQYYISQKFKQCIENIEVSEIYQKANQVLNLQSFQNTDGQNQLGNFNTTNRDLGMRDEESHDQEHHKIASDSQEENNNSIENIQEADKHFENTINQDEIQV